MLKFHVTYYCQSSGFFLCLMFIFPCYLLSLSSYAFLLDFVDVCLPLVLRSGQEINFRKCVQEKEKFPYTGMRHITMLRSTTGRIYDGGLIRL
jgi:hypothetical protein